ncbi:hypothetical protein FXO37_07714 [Capsicum annuum]|nr:hypothetical protein FXO37_07714 [Capsicum annuum]
MYLANTTRPIAFSVNMLARYISTPTRRHRNGISYMSLFYSKDCSPDLIGHADVGYLSDLHKARSQIGYVFICGGTAISWRYTKQSIVSTSSNHAEIIAIHKAIRECPVWMVVCHGFIMYGTVCYVELIDPPPSSTSHRPRRGRPRKIPIPISILPENSNPENEKILKGVNGVATSLISSEDTTMLNARVMPKMDAVMKKRVKLKKKVYKRKRPESFKKALNQQFRIRAMAGREVREYTNLTDPKDKKFGKGKDRIDDEEVTFQRMVSKASSPFATSSSSTSYVTMSSFSFSNLPSTLRPPFAVNPTTLMQEVAGERGGYLHGRGALDSDDLLYLKEQMEAEEDAERLLRRSEKRAFQAFKISFFLNKAVADSSPASIALPLHVEPKPKSGIRQQDLLKRVLEVKPKKQKASTGSDGSNSSASTQAAPSSYSGSNQE